MAIYIAIIKIETIVRFKLFSNLSTGTVLRGQVNCVDKLKSPSVRAYQLMTAFRLYSSLSVPSVYPSVTVSNVPITDIRNVNDNLFHELVQVKFLLFLLVISS